MYPSFVIRLLLRQKQFSVFFSFYPSSVIRHYNCFGRSETALSMTKIRHPSSVIRHPSLKLRMYLIVLFLTKMSLTEMSLTKMSLSKMSLSLCDQGPETKCSLSVFSLFYVLYQNVPYQNVPYQNVPFSLRLRAGNQMTFFRFSVFNVPHQNVPYQNDPYQNFPFSL